MSECGYTWEYIDMHMTIPKLIALIARWKIVPPLAVTLAGIASALGVEMKSKGDESGSRLLAEAQRAAALLNQPG